MYLRIREAAFQTRVIKRRWSTSNEREWVPVPKTRIRILTPASIIVLSLIHAALAVLDTWIRKTCRNCGPVSTLLQKAHFATWKTLHQL